MYWATVTIGAVLGALGGVGVFQAVLQWNAWLLLLCVPALAFIAMAWHGELSREG